MFKIYSINIKSHKMVLQLLKIFLMIFHQLFSEYFPCQKSSGSSGAAVRKSAEPPDSS